MLLTVALMHIGLSNFIMSVCYNNTNKKSDSDTWFQEKEENEDAGNTYHSVIYGMLFLDIDTA